MITTLVNKPQPARGLKNLGNTCFLNAVLQNLVVTEQLRSFMMLVPPNGNGNERMSGEIEAPKLTQRQLKQKEDKEAKEREAAGGGGADGKAGAADGKAASDADGTMTSAARRFFHQMHQGNGAVAPNQVLKAVSARHREFVGRAQQDSQEVLRHLLEGIRSEEVTRLNKEASGPATEAASPAAAAAAAKEATGKKGSKRSKEEVTTEAPPAATTDESSAAPAGSTPRPPPAPDPMTIVDDVFGGELRSTVVCLTCRELSCVREPFLDLSLPIPAEKSEDPPLQVSYSYGEGSTSAKKEASAPPAAETPKEPAEWSDSPPTSPEECRLLAHHAISTHLASTSTTTTTPPPPPPPTPSNETKPSKKGPKEGGDGPHARAH